MIVRPAKNKHENQYNYSNGLLGNSLQSWDKFEDFMEDTFFDCEGQYALMANFIPGVLLPNYCQADSPNNCYKLHDIWVRDFKIPSRQIFFYEAAPKCYTFNAEVWRTSAGLYVRYSTLNLPMRPALEKEQNHVFGLKAHFILQKYLDSESLENLNYLLDLPGRSIVEISAFNRPVGKLKLNSIPWEVRSY